MSSLSDDEYPEIATTDLLPVKARLVNMKTGLVYNPQSDITAAELAQVIAYLISGNSEIPGYLKRHFKYD